ncbi:hypothetical protein LEMLEM_LOCUS8115, partial [Lemmus lemmus]
PAPPGAGGDLLRSGCARVGAASVAQQARVGGSPSCTPLGPLHRPGAPRAGGFAVTWVPRRAPFLPRRAQSSVARGPRGQPRGARLHRARGARCHLAWPAPSSAAPGTQPASERHRLRAGCGKPHGQTLNQPLSQQPTAAATSVPYLDLSLYHLSAGSPA